ncbi:single-stranded DNA-binding protein [Pseudactinotalea sp.]|uniref:single-stranded DNA-binding protein n=1 Tax=Pseudactinotalea sp. TaxID=1926260 RepID=UPI003B3B311F
MSETEVTLRGHLGTNPELQRSTTGKPWVRLRIATNRRIRTPEGWADGATSWYDVKLWGAFAQNVAESLRKGDRVIVQGPLEIEEYTNDKDITFRTAVVHARALGPDLYSATARVAKVSRNEAGEVTDHPPVDVSRMAEAGGGFGEEPDLETEASEPEPAFATT